MFKYVISALSENNLTAQSFLSNINSVSSEHSHTLYVGWFSAIMKKVGRTVLSVHLFTYQIGRKPVRISCQIIMRGIEIVRTILNMRIKKAPFLGFPSSVEEI